MKKAIFMLLLACNFFACKKDKNNETTTVTFQNNLDKAVTLSVATETYDVNYSPSLQVTIQPHDT